MNNNKSNALKPRVISFSQRKNASPIRKPQNTTNLFNGCNSRVNINDTSALSSSRVGANKQIQNSSNRILNIDKLLEQESNQVFSSGCDLFEDKYFPCTNDSLSNDFKMNLSVEWLRPKEIFETYSLDCGEDFKSSQPLQQQLGDCWFISACFSLFSQMGNHFYRKIFTGTDFGMLKFHFYAHGASSKLDKFIKICIDDRLPVKKINKNLIYGCCADSKQFWFPMLEKAYAKLYGSSYENIVAGIPEEAFIDLCGAFTLYLSPQNSSDIAIIKEKLFYLKEKNKLISCADTIPLKATANGTTSKIIIDIKKSHSFVITDVRKEKNEIIIQLKNLWSSSNSIFRELWNLNCKKLRKDNNEFDYSELSLKISDFQAFFGAITFVLHIPDYEKPQNNEFTEISGLLKKSYSKLEIMTNRLNIKETFLEYLLESSEFFLLNFKPKKTSFEVLFNLTQYSTSLERERLRLCLIEVDENFIANYSSRVETNRNGRTLSKLHSFKSDKTYLISIMAISNENQIGKSLSLNYLFRCLHLECNDNEIEIRKLNEKLIGENIKLDVNSCNTCNTVLLNEFNQLKIHKKDGVYYCDDCYIKLHFNNPISGFKGLMLDYNALQ